MNMFNKCISFTVGNSLVLYVISDSLVQIFPLDMNKNVQELHSFPHKTLLFPKSCKLQYTTKSRSNLQYVCF